MNSSYRYVPPESQLHQDQMGRGALIPQRSDCSASVFSLPLTHRQRVISFLVDGRRTIAQCSRREIVEVEAILSELRFLGLIA